MKSIKWICCAIFLAILGCFACFFEKLGMVVGVAIMLVSLVFFVKGAWINDTLDTSACSEEVRDAIDSIKKICVAAYLLPLGCVVFMLGIVGVAFGTILISASFIMFVKGMITRTSADCREIEK